MFPSGCKMGTLTRNVKNGNIGQKCVNIETLKSAVKMFGTLIFLLIWNRGGGFSGEKNSLFHVNFGYKH